MYLAIKNLFKYYFALIDQCILIKHYSYFLITRFSNHTLKSTTNKFQAKLKVNQF